MSALLVGYARCSTDQQDLTAQRDALLGMGVENGRIYVDHGLTGTNRERPGLREALPPGYPGVYPPGDGAALAATISAFVGDPRPWRDAAPAGAEWARARFSPDRMVDGYVDLYRDALGGNWPAIAAGVQIMRPRAG